MDALQVEELLKKAYAFYVVEKDPMFFFLYEDADDATDLTLSLNNLFNDENVKLHIRYNLAYLNIYMTSDETSEFVIREKIPFHKPEHFRFIKPMANMFNGNDVMGRTLSAELLVSAGQLLETGGIYGGRFFPDNQRQWKINKFSTMLIPQE